MRWSISICGALCADESHYGSFSACSAAAAAGGIALINSIGNLGGYVGPFIVGWIKDSTKSFEMALYFLAACAALSVVITYFSATSTRGNENIVRT